MHGPNTSALCNYRRKARLSSAALSESTGRDKYFTTASRQEDSAPLADGTKKLRKVCKCKMMKKQNKQEAKPAKSACIVELKMMLRRRCSRFAWGRSRSRDEQDGRDNWILNFKSAAYNKQYIIVIISNGDAKIPHVLKLCVERKSGAVHPKWF